ncbi:ABC transporter permease [Desulforamulus aquiferis]|uniref:ABC transporter permease subunit n=1 Tax=Desulforamulus aquiferis TaxID=1397668 RepID=A0AAW7ZBE3_9FIRM|nr:ABC transporter permease subunit [Desulforamulus aquiferis]MDO7786671.1 ABC transporter permease subunit [Desulforamulus aquiferis]
MLTIARLTFQEVFKKKVFLITVLMSVAFVLLYGIALDFTAQEMQKMNTMRGSIQVIQQMVGNQLLGAGLYFSSFLLALLALLASVGSIASELENGMLHSIVSKPIRRREIILGKFIGYGIMLSVYALLLYLIILALNGYYNKGALTLLDTGNFIMGAFVFMLQPILLLGVAMVFSTLFRTLTAGIISVILYGIGMIGGFVEQVGSAISNTSLINTGIVSSLIMPSDALFRRLIVIVTGSDSNPLATLNMGPFGVSVPPSNAMLLYTCLYIVCCVIFSIYYFNRKDL